MIKNIYKKSNNKKGFVLLFSVLVSSLLLSIGLAIFNITIKELVLAGSARESQFAIYAADTGADCALYWDIKQGPISEVTPMPIQCHGQSMTVGGTGFGVPSSFSFNLPPESSCVVVTVTKNQITGGAPPRTYIETIIESRGYNTCDTNNPRRIERAIILRY